MVRRLSISVTTFSMSFFSTFPTNSTNDDRSGGRYNLAAAAAAVAAGLTFIGSIRPTIIIRPTQLALIKSNQIELTSLPIGSVVTRQGIDLP